MEIGLNVETISILITLVSVIVTFISVWKKKGWKAALIAVMRSIEKVKVNQETEQKIESAMLIADEIKSDWDKNSKDKAIAKVGTFIDTVYHAQVKDLSTWKKEFDAKLNKG